MTHTMYRTNSLQLASFLATTDGVTFQGIDTENQLSIQFLFDPKDKADAATKVYFAGKAVVNPLELYKNYRMLKDMVFDAKRSLGPGKPVQPD